jgi:hypothetical protein
VAQKGFEVTPVDSAGVDATDTTNHAIKVNVVAGGAGGGLSQLQVRSTDDTTWVSVGSAGATLPIPVTVVSGGSTGGSGTTVLGTSTAQIGHVIVDSGSTINAAITNATLAVTQSGVWVLSTSTGNPVRVDPVGTTPQPVSQNGAWVFSTSSNNPSFVNVVNQSTGGGSGSTSVDANVTNSSLAVTQSGIWVVSTSSSSPAFVTQTSTSIAAVQSGSWTLGASTAQIGRVVIDAGSTVSANITNASIPVTQSGAWVVSTASGNPAWVTQTATSIAVSGTVTVGNASIPVTQSGTWTVASGSNPLYRGRVGTFRTPGRAAASGQKVLSIYNSTGSAVTVTVNKIFIDMLQTVVKAVTVSAPAIRAWKIAAAPTNGTVLTKNQIGGTTTASSSAVDVRGDSSADNTLSATTLTATLPAGAILTQEYAPRMITGAGYEMADRIEFFGESIGGITLKAGEGIALFIDSTSSTSNPATDIWLAGLDWSES